METKQEYDATMREFDRLVGVKKIEVFRGLQNHLVLPCPAVLPFILGPLGAGMREPVFLVAVRPAEAAASQATEFQLLGSDD